MDLQSINVREKTEERIVFRKLPLGLWFVGTAVFITAVYLTATLALGYFGVLFSGPRET